MRACVLRACVRVLGGSGGSRSNIAGAVELGAVLDEELGAGKERRVDRREQRRLAKRVRLVHVPSKVAMNDGGVIQ